MQQEIKTSRTARFTVFSILLLVMLLAACGVNKDKPSETSSITPQATNTESTETAAGSSETPSPSGTEQPKTRTVKDDLGRNVEIPVAPKRVIAGEFASELLAVGVTPIGAGDNSFKIIFTQKEMAGVEKIGDPPNAEKILELSPDLIIAPTVFQEIYPEPMEQLAKIAPIFYVSFDQDPIYDIFPKIADLVGKSTEAKQWIADYEKEAQTAREQVKTAIGDDTVTIFRVEKGRLRVYLNRNFAGYMLHSGLQVHPPEAVAAEIEKNKNGSAFEISLEKLPEYAADHMFIIVRGEGDDQGAFQEIEKSALWKNLPAVKNNKPHFLDTDKYYGSDIVTIRETMKEAVEMLTK
ncbi:ABC transporter substrate-binding protein [Paenibacillus eucommiae]|uniref:Iron complex transport system substrate-binding protein n=1 Tax=Paenibacillus eucommiae TaxID=1355755 RepID=A0ABS4J0J7_9BACL|nr:ABC transporter substrate-binding protein [Paenibacillus eucommiae]MBP1993363.1 iron complex transport system substrate-binding protein [Paenibacillus eucommiae]